MGEDATARGDGWVVGFRAVRDLGARGRAPVDGAAMEFGRGDEARLGA